MDSSVKSEGKEAIASELNEKGRRRRRVSERGVVGHVTIRRSLSRAGHLTDWKCTLQPENDSQKLRLSPPVPVLKAVYTRTEIIHGLNIILVNICV